MVLNPLIKLLKQFDNYTKIGIWFDINIEQTKHLNYIRMYWFGSNLISPVIYRTLNKNFIKPELTEGFNKIIKINKIFYDFNFDNKIKYYF